MRIGVEGRTLQGKRYGVARYLINLLESLVRIDEDNEYLVYLSAPIEPLDFSSNRLDLKVMKMRPSILWRHLRLPLAMHGDKIDVHFSPSYLLPLIKVCPSVVVVHDILLKVHPEWFARDLRFKLDDIFMREVKRAERIVTVSEHSKKDIVEILDVDPSRVVVIREAADRIFHPVKDELELERVREKFDIPGEFILTVGAVHTRRNYERLIQAVALASEEYGIDHKLVIIGAPAPFSPPVDIRGTAERRGIQDRVVQIEYVSEEDLVLLYNACSLFVYPSLYEGFGLPVIEAMACGTPVACADATSLPEVAGGAAEYFDPGSVEDIAGAIGRVLSDEGLREELGSKGKERASQFSWDKAAARVLEVFEEAAR